uniref:Essential for reactive oxygen species protein n=2 Tax=Sus scrofa TaxID=9823 RepID=A0A8D0VFS0_PIG
MYMQVETRTSSCLHLKRAPGIRSWSLLVGIASIGLAAAYYSGDSLGWKLFYVSGCLFVAVQNLEDWQEAIFSKSTGKVVLKTSSLYRKLLTLCRAGHEQGCCQAASSSVTGLQRPGGSPAAARKMTRETATTLSRPELVVVQLSDIRDVSVEEEKVRYFGKGHVVVLRFATGFSHPLTQSAVMGHRGDVEAIARLITTFLELHRLESPAEPSQSSDSEADILGDHS